MNNKGSVVAFPLNHCLLFKTIFICLQKGSLYNGCSSFFHIHHASTHHYISLLYDIQFDFLLYVGCYDSLPNGMPLRTYLFTLSFLSESC
jgi:hypothetical protein